jgi:hypothetical protein
MNLDILTSLLNMSTDSTSWVAEVREGFHTASSECCQSLWHSRLKLRVAKLTFNQATDTSMCDTDGWNCRDSWHPAASRCE